MPQRAKSTDQDFINELISRQDTVIGELEKLESEILDTIESLNSARQTQLDPEAAPAPDSATIQMPHPAKASDDDEPDLSSRAA